MSFLQNNINMSGFNAITGILVQPIFSINASDNTKYDYTEGKGVIVDNTNPFHPTYHFVEIPAAAGITPQTVSSDGVTYIAFDINGEVVERAAFLSRTERRDYMQAGAVFGQNGILQLAAQTPVLAFGQQHTFDDYISAKGAFVTSGNNLRAFSNLQIQFNETLIFASGRNIENSVKNPNIATVVAQTPVLTYLKQYRDGNGGFTTDLVIGGDIDPTKWDDGTGILATVDDNMFTVQEAYLDPTGTLAIVVGQYQFKNMITAITTLSTLQKAQVLNPGLTGTAFLGYIIVRKEAIDLTDLNNAIILPIPDTQSQYPDINNTVQQLIDRLDESLRPRFYGEYSMADNVTATTFSASNTPTKVLGTTINSSLTEGFTHTNNRLTYTGQFTRTFKVTGFMTFTTGAVSTKIGVYVAKNGIVISEHEQYASANVSTLIENAPVQSGVELSTNDYIEIWIENATNSTSVTATHLSCIVSAVD